MKLFEWLKKRFSKNVELGGDITSSLVFVYKLKKGRIWLGTKLNVPENFAFILGKSGKTLDSFLQGDHEFKALFLPKCVKKFKLSTPLKDGSLPTSFGVDAYFVNLNEFEYMKWKSYRKIEMFDEILGYYKLSCNGGFSFRVIKPEDFLQSLLKVYDYLKPNEAEDILSGFVSEFISKEIEKSKFALNEILNLEFLTQKIFESMQTKFSDYGVEVTGLSFERVKFPKNIQERINDLKALERGAEEGEVKEQEEIWFSKKEIVKEQKEEPQNENSWVGYELVNQKKVVKPLIYEEQEEAKKEEIQKEVITKESKIEKPAEKEVDKRVTNQPEIEKKKEEVVTYNKTPKQEQEKQKQTEKPKIVLPTEEVHVFEEPEGEVEFVDLSSDSLYADTKITNKIRCKFCGAENLETSTNCIVCGEKLKRGIKL